MRPIEQDDYPHVWGAIRAGAYREYEKKVN